MLVLGVAGRAAANWNEPAAGSLNLDPTQTGFDPSITAIAGVPYVAWHEYNGTNFEIRVKQLTGGVWAAVGGSPNVSATRGAYIPDITSIAGVPYVTWRETNGTADQVRVAQFNGSAWVAVGDSLNVDMTRNADSPSITSIGGVPYVAWAEYNGTANQVRVAQFSGSAWVVVGGSLNVNPAHNAGGKSITSIGGVPYVAWSEYSGTNNQVYVKQFNGSTWVAVGGSLNVDVTKNAYAPSLTSIGGVPYVAWTEDNGTATQIRVAQFNGSAWVAVGGSLNADPTKGANDASIAAIGGVPFVDWHEYNGTANQIRVAHFDGSNWVAVGGSLNVDPTKSAIMTDPPNLAGIGGVPYAAWTETNGTTFQIRVKRLEPDILSESATPSTTGAVLSAKVNDYGVSLPVGFEFGPSSAFGNQTALRNTPGSGISTVTQTLAGLTPATTYLYRAFGSDSFRGTSQGATQSFTTLALPPPSPPALVTKAVLSALGETNSVFAVGLPSTPLSGQAAISHPRGTVFSFRLDQAATLKIAIQTKTSGRRVHGRCLPNSRAQRHKPSCTRITTIATLTRIGHGGLNKVGFSGRINGKALKPARYQAVFTPSDSAGASAPQTLGFKIVKR